jgi:hypothetical protein
MNILIPFFSTLIQQKEYHSKFPSLFWIGLLVQPTREVTVKQQLTVERDK